MSRNRPFFSLFGVLFAVFWIGGVAWLYVRSEMQRRLNAFAFALEQAGGYLPASAVRRRTRFEEFLSTFGNFRPNLTRYSFAVVDFREANDVDALLPDVALCPDLACVKLGPGLRDPSGLRTLRQLPLLTDVVIDAPNADDGWFEMLAECRTLRRVAVRRGRVSDHALQMLARLPELAVLTIPDAGVTDAGVAELLDHAALRELDLRGGAVSDAAVETQLRMPKLRAVNVWRTSVTVSGADRLRREGRLHVVH